MIATIIKAYAMKKPLFPLISFIATLLLSGSALASSIEYETRLIDPSVDTSNYKDSWSSQSAINSPITSNFISDFNGTLPGNNSFAHLDIGFDVGGSNTGTWAFQIAPDAGYGGAIYLDGAILDYKSHDLWWGGNWNSSSQILTGSLSLSAGHHVLEGYWAENCCNGQQGGRFSINGGNWQDLTTANLNAANVPAPATLSLFVLGLAGLAFFRKTPLAKSLAA
jgi:hypothetical protein